MTYFIGVLGKLNELPYVKSLEQVPWPSCLRVRHGGMDMFLCSDASDTSKGLGPYNLSYNVKG